MHAHIVRQLRMERRDELILLPSGDDFSVRLRERLNAGRVVPDPEIEYSIISPLFSAKIFCAIK